MIEYFLRFWHLKDLRNKILLTIILLLIVRFLIFIPLPLIQTSALKQLFDQNALLGFLNLFSGGGLRNFAITTMGVGPYITASIIIQLLTTIVPRLEELQKEGASGQRQLNQYTRVLTVPMALIQAYGVLIILKQNNIISNWTPLTLISTLITMTAGTMFVLWLGEIISERGIGNGVSLIITLGILGAFPTQVQSLITTIQAGGSVTQAITLFFVFVISIIVIIVINEGKLEVPIAYARRIRESRFGGVQSHLPIKVNAAGVIPIIFAIALLTMPTFIGQLFSHARSHWLAVHATQLAQLFQPTNHVYTISYFVLVFAFTYFYTYVIFQPNQVAENLQKQGGFIPGVRPGKETEGYIRHILNRVTLVGAIFLAIIAVLPNVLQGQIASTNILLGGTSLLIVVAVILDTMRQIQSQYLMRTYDVYNP